jgi:hypothetical protein
LEGQESSREKPSVSFLTGSTLAALSAVSFLEPSRVVVAAGFVF